jgi:hydroxymethylglutaryl-CoA lyase
MNYVSDSLEWVECPRDAMQGLPEWIDTSVKVEYLNLLLRQGFHTLDCGSFVSPAAVPQMKDTAEVLNALDRTASDTRLLVIIANERGVREALAHPAVDDIGFPLSISEEFQQRNTRSTREAGLELVLQLQRLATAVDKRLVVYLSMAFGNPYGEDWNTDLVVDYAQRLDTSGVSVISLADTVGTAQVDDIAELCHRLTVGTHALAHARLGIHLHTTATTWEPKVAAAWQHGCRRFDTAILGFGGCPFAKNELVGNLNTYDLLAFAEKAGIRHSVQPELVSQTYALAQRIFRHS